MANIRNLTIVVEFSGKHIPVREVDETMTAEQLLRELAGRINLPAGTRGTLQRKVTRKQILPTQTLGNAGVEDNETLLADFERTAG